MPSNKHPKTIKGDLKGVKDKKQNVVIITKTLRKPTVLNSVKDMSLSR